jgi:acyl carrier protein
LRGAFLNDRLIKGADDTRLRMECAKRVARSMSSAQLRAELKRIIVAELNLKGRDPESIDDDAPLFGSGLGLDSLDALQLAMAVEEQFGVRIPEGDQARQIFRSVRTIADHVAKVQSG